MKRIILLTFAFLLYTNAYTQEFKTEYIRGKSSTFCGKESYSFDFQGDFLYKIDNYDSKRVHLPSRKKSSNYDDKGYYFELWSPNWYLETYGIDEYNKVKKYMYKLLFNKRGGDLLYIFEFDINEGMSEGKFYFSQKGFEIYCNTN